MNLKEKNPCVSKVLVTGEWEIDAVCRANIQRAQLPSPSFVATLGQLFCQILSYSRRSDIFQFLFELYVKDSLAS